MRLTNKFNLPEPIVAAILDDDYDKGPADYSVTELLKPPRMVQLEARHADEIEEDAIDHIWSLFGASVHNLLEKQDLWAIAEKRFFIKRTVNDKPLVIGGKFDRFVFMSGGIEDYKVTSVWHVKNLEPGNEWEFQLNMYRHILAENNLDVSYLRVNALLRDWSMQEARRIENYPSRQFVTVDLPLWEPERCERELMARLRAHEEAKVGALPLCSDADRWKKGEKWAVMKEGRKTAVRLFDSEGEAGAFIFGEPEKESRKEYVEKRPGSYPRCEFYCPVADFCDQWKNDPDNPKRFLEGL